MFCTSHSLWNFKNFLLSDCTNVFFVLLYKKNVLTSVALLKLVLHIDIFEIKNDVPTTPTTLVYFSTPANQVASQINVLRCTYKIPSNKIKRIFFVSISKRLELLFNQLPSDALLLLLCKSGGGRKRFGYGAALVALTFPFDNEKHPLPTQPDSIDEDVDAAFERDAFSFNDLKFPLMVVGP